MDRLKSFLPVPTKSFLLRLDIDCLMDTTARRISKLFPVRTTMMLLNNPPGGGKTLFNFGG